MLVQANAACLLMENMAQSCLLQRQTLAPLRPRVRGAGHKHTEDTALAPPTLPQPPKAQEGRHRVVQVPGPLLRDMQAWVQCPQLSPSVAQSGNADFRGKKAIFRSAQLHPPPGTLVAVHSL